MSANQSAKTYVRKRAFSKIHVKSWLIYLEKDGYVRCSFQNCNFMAFNVEEMCNHFGYCTGDSSSAKFECEHCKGRTDSLKKLQLHLSQAHNVETSTSKESIVKPNFSESDPVCQGKPSKVVMCSWSCFFDKHNYVKCVTCNYIANTLADMCRHYKICKQEMAELLYVCPVCKGRTINVNPLLWHMEKSHKIFKAPSQFNHITKAMISYWEKELQEKKLVCCLHILSGKRDCSYFDLDVLGIIEHAQCCKGPQFQMKREQCPCCPKWTNSKDKLKKHLEFSHLNSGPIYKNTPWGGSFDNLVLLKSKVPNQQLNELGTVKKESNLPESSTLPKENKTTSYLQMSTGVYAQLSTLLPSSLNSNEIQINENMVSECELEQFQEVVIPPSLYAVSSDQENTVVLGPRQTSSSDSCKDELLTKPNNELSNSSSKPNEDLQTIIKSNENDPFKVFIKEEVVGICQEDELKQDVEMNKYTSENGKIEVTNSEVNQDLIEYKYSPNEKSSIVLQESSIEGNQEFLSENEQDKSLMQDHLQVIEEDLDNKVDFMTKFDVMDEKRKRMPYALFKDDTSDEDDPLPEYDNNLKTKNLVNNDDRAECINSSCLNKPSEDIGNKILSKNYLRRPRSVKSARFSPIGHMSSSTVEDSSLLPENLEGEIKAILSSIIEEVVKMEGDSLTFPSIGNHSSKIEHFNTQEKIVFENCVKKDNKLPEEIAKSSEKNDKLLLSYPIVEEPGSQSSEKCNSQTSTPTFNMGNIEVVGIEYNIMEDKSTKTSCNNVVELEFNNTFSSDQNAGNVTSVAIKMQNIDKSSSPTVVANIVKHPEASNTKEQKTRTTTVISPTISSNITKNPEPSNTTEQIPKSMGSKIDNRKVPMSCSKDVKVIDHSQNHEISKILDCQQNRNLNPESLTKDTSNTLADTSSIVNYKSGFNYDVEYNVSFSYEGKLNKSFTSVSTSLDENEEEIEQNSVISYSFNTIQNKNISPVPKINSSNLRKQYVPFLKICYPNNRKSTIQNDLMKLESSDLCNESSQEGEFLGTDEEPDMKGNLFNGFPSLSYTKSRNFRSYLNRLSESENEEWYVNAGNLDMNVRKQNCVSSKKGFVGPCNDDMLRLRDDSTNNLESSCKMDETEDTERIEKLKHLDLPIESNYPSPSIKRFAPKENGTDNELFSESLSSDETVSKSTKTKVESPIKRKRGRPPKIVDQLAVEEMEKYVENIKQKVLNTLRKEKKNREDHDVENKSIEIKKKRLDSLNTSKSEYHSPISTETDIQRCNMQGGKEDFSSAKNTVEVTKLNSNCLSIEQISDNLKPCINNTQPEKNIKNANEPVYQNKVETGQSRDNVKIYQKNLKDHRMVDNQEMTENENQDNKKILNTGKRGRPCKRKGLQSSITYSKVDTEENTFIINYPEIHKSESVIETDGPLLPDENELLISVFSDKAEMLLESLEDDSNNISKENPSTKGNLLETSFQKINSPLPKRRGRPPKVKNNQSSNSLLLDTSFHSDDCTKSAINKSFFGNVNNDGNLDNTNQSSQQQIKMKVNEVNNPKDLVNSSVDKLLVVKRRGRPPKVISDESPSHFNKVITLSEVPTVDTDVTPTVLNDSKSGNILIQETETDYVAESAIKSLKSDIDNSFFTPKKRGRPPKVKSDENPCHFNKDITLSEVTTVDTDVTTTVLNDSKSGNILIQETETDYVAESAIKPLKSDFNNSFCTPKKRGRPRKVNLNILPQVEKNKHVKKSVVNYLNADIVNLMPKKRGRPPKPKCYNINKGKPLSEVSFTDTDASPSAINDSQSGDLLNQVEENVRTTKSVVNSSNTNIDNTIVMPKKRGRPRKVKISDNHGESYNSPIIHNKRGRIPNNSSSELENLNIGFNINQQISDPEQSSIKKRGRPRKQKTNRGRPRKNAVVRQNEEIESGGSGSELLGTDIIVINKEKLNTELVSSGSKNKRKCRIKLNRYDDSSSDDNLQGSLNKSSDESTDNDYDDIEDNSDYEPPVKRKGRFSFKANVASNQKKSKPGESSFFKVKKDVNDKVVCGVCKQAMNYGSYRNNHAIFKHYMLCWLEGDEPPLNMDDAKEVVNRLWYAKKKLGKIPFKCFKCNIPKLSAVGFQSHIRFCGKEHSEKMSLLVTCEICGTKMMPSSMKPHLNIKHKQELEQNSILDSQSCLPKKKRAAASRAVEVIQSQKEEEGQIDTGSRPSSPDTRQFLAPLYTKPNKSVPNDEYERWKTSLKEINIVKCAHPDCKFFADSTCSFRRHYFDCPFAPPRWYKCRKCTFTSLKENLMQDHIVEKHEEFIQDLQSSENDSSDDGEGEDPGRLRHSHFNNSLPFKFLRSGYMIRRHGSINRFFFPESFKWTLRMRSDTLSEDILFADYEKSASKLIPLTQDKIPNYAPQEQKSVQFKGIDNTWYTLRCFEATLLDGVPLFFAGGPVWAVAWAPVPDTETQQFLAVSTHPTMERTHEMSAVYNYNSLIQIWNIGYLTNLEHSGETPKFLLGLAHGRGAVWALRWCPSGCYQENRLGLLAASCSDGSVAIFSIPRYRQSFEYTMYKADPDFELKLGCEMLSQCTSLEWQSWAPHNLIVGGFANGMVAIWDLSTTSPLLRDGITIYPFKVIEAHLSAVTAVGMTDKLLMTASLDRATKFWQLDDSLVPVNTLRKASVMDAVMPSHWLTSINAYDDVYSMNSSHVTGYSFRETHSSNNTNFLLQPGTIWSLSFNDWLNSCVCASEMGKLSVFFRQQLLVTEDSKKVKKGSLVADIMTASVQPLNSWSSIENFGPKYSDCVSHIGLQLNFKSQLNDSSRSKPGCSSDTMDSYPILAINKVTWNPNMHSFSWMAAGMQCGLVVVPHIRSIVGREFSDLYKNMDQYRMQSSAQ